MFDHAYVFRYAETEHFRDFSIPCQEGILSHNTFTITDYSQENSTFGFESAVLTTGNISSQTGLLATLETKTEALSIGHVAKQQIAQILVDDPGVPTDPFAQRELKWLVTYQAVTSGMKYTLEIPAPDLTDNLVVGSDLADLSSTAWDEWITAFVAVAKPADDLADSVIVLSARLVGRNI